jgi:hypothetical protein
VPAFSAIQEHHSLTATLAHFEHIQIVKMARKSPTLMHSLDLSCATIRILEYVLGRHHIQTEIALNLLYQKAKTVCIFCFRLDQDMLLRILLNPRLPQLILLEFLHPEQPH